MSEKKEAITEKKVDRRSMLKWTGALAAAVAVGAVAGYEGNQLVRPPPPPPPSFKSPLSPEIQTRVNAIVGDLQKKHEGEEIFYTRCPENGKCYGPACVLEVHVKDGVLVCTDGDDSINENIAREDEYISDDAVKTGMFQARPCNIGHSYAADINSPTRVRYPMKQVGERGSRNFVRITWEEAISTIAQKWIEMKEKYGPYSIHMPESYEGLFSPVHLIGDTFGAGVQAWGGVSTSGVEAAEYFICSNPNGWGGIATGMDEGYSPLDLFNSKLIVLWSYDPAVSRYEHEPYILKLIKEKLGTPIIVIDHRYTHSASVLADQWIPIKASTDHAMLLAVANVLLTEDLWDHEYVAKWVEPNGFQKWSNYVLGKTPDNEVQTPDDQVNHTPEWAAPLCGVPAETIREFARLYAKSKPVHLNIGYDVIGKQHRGNNVTAVAMILQTMTGNLTIPGGCQAGSTMSNPMSMNMPTPAAPNLGGQPPQYTAPVPFVCQQWAEAVLLREPFDNKQITEEDYRHAIGCGADQPLPNIHMLDVRNNVLNNYHDINKRIKAFMKLDFVYGLRGDFTQPTTWFCDIILPRPYHFLEASGMEFDSWSGEGLWGYTSRFGTPTINGPKNTITYLQKPLVTSPGDIRPYTWFYVQLAKALGIASKFPMAAMADVTLDKWNDTLEQYDKQAYETWAARDDVKAILGAAPPSWDEFNNHKKAPVIRWPDTKPHYAYQLLTEAGKNPFDWAPSHKIEFYSTLAAKSNAAGGTLRFGRFYDPLNRWQPTHDPEPPEQTFYDPRAVDYPIIVTSPVTPFRQHSRGDSNPLLNECYRHAIWLSVADAKARGIVDGDLVRVSSLQGEMILPAYVTSRETPGNAAVHHGAWYQPAELKTTLDPYGVDMRGAPNILFHDIYRNDTVAPIIDKGIVQVEKFSAVVR